MEVLFKVQYSKYLTSFYKDYSDLQVKKDYDEYEKEVFSFKNGGFNEKHPMFSFDKTSNSEKVFEENFGNPLAMVSVDRLTLVVERNDDKVSLKLYMFNKCRQVGNVYFKKQTQCNFITYSFKDKTLYTGKISNSFKKRKNVSSVRRNYFASKPFQALIYQFHNNYIPFKKVLNLNEDSSCVKNAINIFISQIPNLQLTDEDNYDSLFYKHYLDTRQIKYPDNYITFMSKIPLPNKRILKKCGNKLVDSFMMNNNLKGDKIRKILHRIDGSINEYFYHQVESFFGEKFLRHQSEEILDKILTYGNGYQINGDLNTLSDSEKINAFEVFKQRFFVSPRTFIDHIDFYIKLKGFGENIRWKSNNSETFNQEHMLWSDMISQYMDGIYTRTYSDEFVDGVQEVIHSMGNGEYHPVVLKTSYDYNQESLRQSNCVRTYINKASSFIISLREGSATSEERATIEYGVRKKADEITLRRVQSLGRFNKSLDTKWFGVLEILDERINTLVNGGKFKLPKVKVEFKHTSIESESMFQNSSLVWVSPNLDGVKNIVGYNDFYDENLYDLNF